MASRPLQSALRSGGIGDQSGGVALTASNELDGHGQRGNGFNGTNDFENRIAGSGTDVDGATFAAVTKVLQCLVMRGRQIPGVDVVANGRPVRGGVVGTEDLKWAAHA